VAAGSAQQERDHGGEKQRQAGAHGPPPSTGSVDPSGASSL
jgi:hypothetical protein